MEQFHPNRFLTTEKNPDGPVIDPVVGVGIAEVTTELLVVRELLEFVLEDVDEQARPGDVEDLGDAARALDVVGLGSDGTLVAGECNYTTRRMTQGDLADLERTARAVQWTPDGGEELTYHYCCFCRSGFSDGLRTAADERADLSLFTPGDIVG